MPCEETAARKCHIQVFRIRQKLLIAPECHFLFHGPLTFIAEIIEIQILVSQLITNEWQSELEDLRLISQRVKLFTLPWFPISSNPKKLLHTSGSRAAWPCQALRDVKRQFYCFCILVIVSISVCTQGNCGENTFSNLKRHSLCYTTDAHICVWGKLLNYQHSDSELKHGEKFNVNPPVISWLLPRLGRVHFRRASLCI